MSYRIDPVTADKATIDKYLGNGEYTDWSNEMASAKRALADYTALRDRIPVHWLPYLAGESDIDAEMVETAANNCGIAIQQIQAGKKVNKAQFRRILEIQSTALEALKEENDNLEAILDIGFFAAWMQFQFSNIEFAAAQALPKVKALEEALRQAKKRAREAEVQGIVDMGLTVLSYFLPELAVLTKVSIAVGQWAMDDYLGGSKSSETKDNLSNVNSGAAVGQAAIEDWKWLTPRQTKTVKRGGKAIAVVGLYFDADEISTALKDVNVTQATLDAAIDAMYKVRSLLERQRPAMVQLKLTLIRVANSIKDSQATVDELHRDMHRQMDAAQFYSNSAVQWRYD